MTRLLVLGGSGFVGRVVAAEAAARGYDVTTFNRGTRDDGLPAAVRRIVGDRADPAAIAALAGAGEWDLVVDTWSGAPRVAQQSARALASRTQRCVYISSISVYQPVPPVGFDETAATVQGADPGAAEQDYAADKRGGELAIIAAYGERALLARAGLILGPHEDVGRLPWWLGRVARGGRVLAPGPPDRPLAFIDVRDLAGFVLQTALSGPCNLVSPRGHTTTGQLLAACLQTAGAPDTELVWTDPATIAAAGIQPWTELPIWRAPDTEDEGMLGANVDRALQAGLRCRPVEQTVADTWAWMRSLTGPPPLRADRPAPGLDPDAEHAALSR